jgi:hypothetical protein
MRKLIVISILALAACGGKKPATGTTGGGGSGSAAPAAETCCCALASDPVTYETQPKEKCETDTHGTCSDASHCAK